VPLAHKTKIKEDLPAPRYWERRLRKTNLELKKYLKTFGEN
jgi:hypothetical protein